MSDLGPVPAPPGLRVGSWVLGELLGAGAWGSVYAARSDGGSTCAIKLLPDPAGAPGRSELAEIVAREVAAASRPTPPGCLPVHEVLRVEAPNPPLDGAYALVMPRARCSVADLLRELDDARPVPDAEPLLAAVWEALSSLHRAGWVHGDLKPANVLVLDDGRVLLADLGLAGELEGTHAYAPAAVSLDYVGPEWFSERVGLDGALLRPTRDLWAFGVLAHQVFSGGRFCFDGQDATARSHAAREYAAGHATLRLAPGLPEPWAEAVRALLAPTEAGRREAGAAVDAALRETGVVIQDGRRRRILPGRRGGWLVAGAGLASAVGAVVLAVAPFEEGSRAEAERRPATGEAAQLLGDLREDSRVPDELRPLITAAARRCPSAAVTPALIAALLDSQSGFDVDARDDVRGLVGIAMWTPSVFEQWAVDQDGGGASPLSAPDAVFAVGQYLCAKDTVVAAVPGDRGLLLAASYLTSADRVVAAGGVPADVQEEVDRVAVSRDELGLLGPTP